MATASSSMNQCSRFSAALGNEELSLVVDAEHQQLEIELANASRFVVHKKIISKQEEIREITGLCRDNYILNSKVFLRLLSFFLSIYSQEDSSILQKSSMILFASFSKRKQRREVSISSRIVAFW